MNLKSDIDPELMRKLSLLQPTSPRNPEKEKTGRAAFLEEAQEFSGAITQPEKWRHNGWMHSLQSIFMNSRKEHSPMLSTFATVLIVLSLVLGGGGITVAAAQNSLPDQPLYGVKVWSEDARLNLTSDAQSEYQLALEFTNRRAEEIQAMVQAEGVNPEAVQTRYQNQVEQALQYAMNLPDDQAVQALQQIRLHLQLQQQAFLQTQAHGEPIAEAVFLQTRQMLQERLQWVELGLTAPGQLRDQLYLRDPVRKQDRVNAPTTEDQPKGSPGAGSGNPWNTDDPTPGSGPGPGPDAGPGPGPGPGPEPTRTCTPGAGNNTGPQPAQNQGNQPANAGPQSPQGPQPTESSFGPQSTPAQDGQRGKP